MLSNYGLTKWGYGGMKNEAIKHLISYSVFIKCGSRLATSAEVSVPSGILQCFEIMMLRRKKGNPFTGHFFVEAKKRLRV